MSNNSPKKGSQKEYFNNLLTKFNHPQRGEHQVLSILNSSMMKIEGQLQKGNLAISSKQKTQQLAKMKQQKYAKQMQILNKQINQNDQIFKKAKRQLLLQKKTEAEMKKNANQTKAKEVTQKVKKWSEIQKELKQKREQIQLNKQKLQTQLEQRLKREQEQKKEWQKLQKKKNIQQSLKKIEENKTKRDQIIKASQHQMQQLQPKFKEIQQKFKQFEQQLKFQQEIQRKNHKLGLKIDHQAIKAHQKAYLTKVQQRKNVRSESQSPKSADGNREKDFNQFFTRNQQKLAQQKQKLKRRKEFQQKLKQIPVMIDQSKKVKVQIAIDKGKNPHKYNFLGQKALNDFQIYGQFREFQLNVNAKDIGKEYLKQLPELIKSSRAVKSQSTSSLKVAEKPQKIEYKDYLKDLKMQRSQRGSKTQQQIIQILKNHKSKSKAIQELNQKSKQYQLQAKKKMSEMQRYNGLQSVLKKQKEVDQIYLKSIRAKLACLEIQQ